MVSYYLEICDMELEVLLTQDGFHTILNKSNGVTYHSKFGSVQESKHVYVNAGFEYIAAKFNYPINILEIGFGTGLNAYLTSIYSKNLNREVNYIAIEKYPLPLSIINQLNYSSIDANVDSSIFFRLHSSEWDEETLIHEYFSLKKIHSDASSFGLADSFHCIYMDAFAPDDDREDLWSEEIFSKLFNSLEINGCLVTFCAKGSLKRLLKKIGFMVETLPGPSNKREMIRAIKLG